MKGARDEARGEPSPTAAKTVAELRRLGRNINGYFGERIDIETVVGDCAEAAQEHGWASEHIEAAPGLRLLALKRAPRESEASPRRVYISAGIHGDEPASPLAARRLLREDRWPPDVALWLCPCLNPTGFAANRRENAVGADLNREYRKPQAMEIIAHIAWLDRQPRFDLCLCLHEDWEAQGFYLYELNPDEAPSAAPAILERVSEVCPIDSSEIIEGRAARGGLIRPSIDPRSRPEWPEAFFLLTHKTALSYTLEAPSDFPLETRVAALCAGVRAALDFRHGQ